MVPDPAVRADVGDPAMCPTGFGISAEGVCAVERSGSRMEARRAGWAKWLLPIQDNVNAGEAVLGREAVVSGAHGSVKCGLGETRSLGRREVKRALVLWIPMEVDCAYVRKPSGVLAQKC